MAQDVLFEESLISQLDITEYNDKISYQISLPNLPQNLVIRPLAASDYDLDYIKLLGELTSVGDVTQEIFLCRFNQMKNCKGTYYVLVIEDKNDIRIVGTATLVVEQKFIHECSQRGRIEDVVVNSEYRGKELGKVLIIVLSSLARKLGCYKVTLECKNKMIPFYENFGFHKESDNSNYLQKRF